MRVALTAETAKVGQIVFKQNGKVAFRIWNVLTDWPVNVKVDGEWVESTEIRIQVCKAESKTPRNSCALQVTGFTVES